MERTAGLHGIDTRVAQALVGQLYVCSLALGHTGPLYAAASQLRLSSHVQQHQAAAARTNGQSNSLAEGSGGAAKALKSLARAKGTFQARLRGKARRLGWQTVCISEFRRKDILRQQQQQQRATMIESAAKL